MGHGMSPDEKIRRGDAARRIMDDAVVKEALAAIKSEIVGMWSNTPPKDTEGREWIWRHHKVAEKFELLLKAYIETGKFESGLLEQKSKLALFRR